MNLDMDVVLALSALRHDNGGSLVGEVRRQRIRQGSSDFERVVRLLKQKILVRLGERAQLDKVQQLGDGSEGVRLRRSSESA